MKYILPAFLLLVFSLNLRAQTQGEVKEGAISYITPQNVYVKFLSTENISAGDTLYIIQNAISIPVMVVKEFSSISCVCAPISAKLLSVGDKILSQRKISMPVIATGDTTAQAPQPITIKKDTVVLKKEVVTGLKQNISGRISVSSYSNFSSTSAFSQQMRYNFSLDANNLGNSKLSGEAYVTFANKLNEWSDVKANIFNGLKIYSLALDYAFNKNNSLSVGRKMNPRLSSVGAIDGLQYETKYKSISAGVIAGSRPDYMNYGFNPKLLQYGGYIGHDYNSLKGNMQTTLAFVEQKNNGYTDRRFAYVQHSNSLLPKLYFFGSVEFDLYNKVFNPADSSLTQNNKPTLSNLYVSMRYKIAKPLSVSLSYSARQNIIYYETYKSIVDQLLEAATMQGYMLQVNCHPGRIVSFGANAGYRFSKTDPRPSKNLYSFLTFSNVPLINASATISATLLETAYVNGSIYSLGFSRDLLPGKLYGGISYRYVDYKFVNSEAPLVQNMGEIDLNWQIMKKLSVSLTCEGTFEKNQNFNRVYVNLTQRF